MKRLLLVLGVALALAGCGGGGGGSSTPSVPNNPGNPGNPGGGGGPSPTPLPTATNGPSTVVVVATSSPMALAKTAINPGSTASDSAAATVTGQGMSAGSALYATVTSNDKSGSTCLVLIPQGSNSQIGLIDILLQRRRRDQFAGDHRGGIGEDETNGSGALREQPAEDGVRFFGNSRPALTGKDGAGDSQDCTCDRQHRHH